MGDKSRIEWTDATWNMIRAYRTIPLGNGAVATQTGWHCEHVSEGCRNCYAERMNLWRGTTREFKPASLEHRGPAGILIGDVVVRLDGETLHQPLHWTRPRRIFVCSMTDLFGSFVEDAWIDFVLAVCALTPRHTFQILTKRSAAMRAYFSDPMTPARIGQRMDEIARATGMRGREHAPLLPLSNVWLGVSAEDQKNADERVPDLALTPAAVRFVSAEPLLARIKAHSLLVTAATMAGRIDLIIAGGESGLEARPTHPDNVRQLRDDCAATGAFFDLKQWGEWGPDPGSSHVRAIAVERDGRTSDVGQKMASVAQAGECWHRMYRVGKGAAGRLLDGVLHDGADQLHKLLTERVVAERVRAQQGTLL